MNEHKIRQAKQLIPAIEELIRRASEMESTHQADLQLVAPDYLASAQNLLHYLAVRQTDIRNLQMELAELGMTSLGNTETAVLYTLDNVLRNLYALIGEPCESKEYSYPVTFQTGPMMLEAHAKHLLGEACGKRRVRIMVTMPSEAAKDPHLIYNLLEAGMDAMRINCAHDDQEAWSAMIKKLRKAERILGRSCKVYADLAGPKLRTGAIQPIGQVVKFRPQRDFKGRVVREGCIWLTPTEEPEAAPEDADVTVPVDADFLSVMQVGDQIRLRDTRERQREMLIKTISGHSCLAETDRTNYVETGMMIRLYRDDELIAQGQIGVLPDLVLPIWLKNGDNLILTRDDIPGEPAQLDEEGNVLQPAHIPCTLKEAFDSVQVGERVLFDDGKIHGQVLENDRDNIRVEITFAGINGAKLRPEKGINLPDTTLTMPSLTEKDLEDLAFMVNHADIIGLSFVRTPEDVNALEEQLRKHNALDIGVVLKIETRQGFENLPRLLLATMRTPPDGIMVARGDLAAEIGFERMAEVQEEVLWFCEAAQIPVIWATQVLESLAQKGAPSRAEVTDVVMSGRAECVMLNKGPYIVETVRFLSGVLERMAAHRSKRRSMLRKLAISEVD